LVRTVKVDFGGEYKDFPLGVSILLYGAVASGKTTFCLTLVREFLRNNLPIVWICLDESPNAVREKMAYFQVDYAGSQERNILRFIDIYSEQVTGKPLADPHVINCSSASNLNEINRSLMEALREVEGQGLVVFDSISTLLLYNRAGTAEEFMKVHLSRITSAGFTGFFILQRDLQEVQTEETLKMICDSVLEFGFDKDVRKIGILKLPLGTSGDWIESSLFAWNQPPSIAASRPFGPRKFMDAGGYLEEFKEHLIEGIKDGLTGANKKSADEAASAAREGRRPGENQPGDDSMPPGGPRPGEGFNQHGQYQGQMQQPTVQHIDKQIIVTEFAGLPDKLGDEIKNLLSEQLKLRDEINEKEELTKESKKRLDLLAGEESEAAQAFRELKQQEDTIHKTILERRKELAELDAQKRMDEGRHKEVVKLFESAKSKVDGILSRKKELETKLHDLVEDSGELYIDIAPYIKDVIAKREAVVAKSKGALESFDLKIASKSGEITTLEAELAELVKRDYEKRSELEEVRNRKAKVESEVGNVSRARDETEARLKEILMKKREMESKLRELGGGE
jgi:KaiC/GvpD/RAD55 family RecA-like ATPase